jgi:hypothetical protein
MPVIRRKTQTVRLDDDTDILRIVTRDLRVYDARWAGPLNAGPPGSDIQGYVLNPVATYRGLPIPEDMGSDDERHWRRGVDAALGEPPFPGKAG